MKVRRNSSRRPLAKKPDLAAAEPRHGKTVLHEAALRGYSAIVSDLLKAGADRNAKDKKGRTAPLVRAQYGNGGPRPRS